MTYTQIPERQNRFVATCPKFWKNGKLLVIAFVYLFVRRSDRPSFYLGEIFK